MALQFSAEGEEQFQEITSRYPNKLAALQPVLLLAQSEFGWISVEVMEYVAARLELNETQVLTTATFYTMYNKQPIGKCHIQVCTTLSCALRNGYDLLDEIEDRLGITTGQTSADGKYTLSEVECLASCGTAPMFQVTYSDGEMHYFEDLPPTHPERLDAAFDEIEKVIETLESPKQMHKQALKQ